MTTTAEYREKYQGIRKDINTMIGSAAQKDINDLCDKVDALERIIIEVSPMINKYIKHQILNRIQEILS